MDAKEFNWISKDVKDVLWNEGPRPDHIRRNREGIFSWKRGYYYHHGATAEGFAEGIKKSLGLAGYTVSILRCEDHFKWPKDSFFLVTFTVSR